MLLLWSLNLFCVPEASWDCVVLTWCHLCLYMLCNKFLCGLQTHQPLHKPPESDGESGGRVSDSIIASRLHHTATRLHPLPHPQQVNAHTIVKQ